MDSLPIKHTSSFFRHAFCPVKLDAKYIRKRQAGFTLLEVLAVVVIVGIIVSFASLSVGQKSSHVIQEEAERLYGLLSLANEETVMQGRELALEFQEEGYSFLELNIDNQWIPLEQDKLLRERSFPPNIKIKLIIEGVASSFEDKKNLPRVFVLSSGELTPFQITLSLDDEESYTLQGAMDGKLTLSKSSDHDFES